MYITIVTCMLTENPEFLPLVTWSVKEVSGALVNKSTDIHIDSSLSVHAVFDVSGQAAG